MVRRAGSVPETANFLLSVVHRKVKITYFSSLFKTNTGLGSGRYAGDLTHPTIHVDSGEDIDMYIPPRKT